MSINYFSNLPLLKAENPDAYKKLAEQGMMVAHPVKIAGQEKRPDIGIPYHSTIKFFNTDKDTPEQVHETASQLKFNPPDPKQTHIEPGMFKDRFGNDVYVLKLHGPHTDQLKEHHGKFSHMGHKEAFEYHPHVSVDKATWDKVVASKAKTAHDAGIEFGPAELRQGHKVLQTYGKSEDLEKGWKNFASALGVVSALHGATPASAPVKDGPNYERGRLLNAIQQVESSGGKNQVHKPVGGMHHDERAYGKWALMPNTIRETIKLNPELKRKYGKGSKLQGNDLHHYMQDNPGLEDRVADLHLKRLEHHFPNNPAAISFAWNQGVVGTNKALNNKQDVGSHQYTQKIKDAYLKGK